MVSGLLAQLGIPMGETIDEANIEDLEFTAHRGYRRLFWGEELQDKRVEYIEHLTRQIRLRNEKYSCWGWKDPIAIYYLADIEKHLINPHYILITRDPGAIAMAEMVAFDDSEPRVLLDYFSRAANEYERCIRFLSDRKQPLLVVSYERSLRYPNESVYLCAQFVLGEKASLPRQELDKLVSYIRPDRRTAEIGATVNDAVRPTVATEPAGHFDTYRSWMDAVAARITPYDEAADAGKEAGAEPETDEWHNRLAQIYSTAATALNRGERQTAGTMACRCLKELARPYPMVALGPVAIAGAVDVDPTAAQELPDLLVGVYNVVGLVTLEDGDAGVAQDHFEAGHVLARRRLEEFDPPDRPMSTDLVWWLAFHAALSAKTADRPIAWRRNIDAIRGSLDSAEGQASRVTNRQSAQSMYERAVEEGLV